DPDRPGDGDGRPDPDRHAGGGAGVGCWVTPNTRHPPTTLWAVADEIVALVGRPNVGKSTLFNRLVGEQIAVVEDLPGTTRDRIYGEVEWSGKYFTLIDTGGIEGDPETEISKLVRAQARAAVDEADLIVFGL